jgi:hypothetical protein
LRNINVNTKEIKITNSKEITSEKVINFNELKLFNRFPKKTETKTIGENPIKEVKQNNVFLIFRIDKNKFCNINGGPGIIRSKIKYSKDESAT